MNHSSYAVLEERLAEAIEDGNEEAIEGLEYVMSEMMSSEQERYYAGKYPEVYGDMG